VSYVDDRPKLSKKEIENAAAIFKSFTNPVNKLRLRYLFEECLHRSSLYEFHALTWKDLEAPSHGDWDRLSDSDKERFAQIKQNILDSLE
jgi:hypothetical protein